MTSLPDFLESGEIARLIPVIADSRREQRVASVFLATISAVPDLARPIMAEVGVRLGKRSVLDTYTEIVLRGHGETKDRPDGLISISTGRATWRALVEAKIGSATIEDNQVQRYLQIARDQGFDAVITISNQFATRPSHSPVTAPKALTKKVGLFHFSWKMILTEAIIVQSQETAIDPDQAFLLREFIRFLSHDSVGVSGFNSMPPQWRDVVTLVKTGGAIAKTSPETEAVVAAWHQETRDLALRMSQHLAANVSVRLPRAHATDSDQRLREDCAELSAQKRLEVEYEIPNAASALTVTADLMSQTIRVGMEVGAPQDRQRSTARVNWLLRQFKSDDEDPLFIRIAWPSRVPDTVCRLSDLRMNADSIVGGASVPPKSFEVFYLCDDGRRFSGRKTFIEEIERAVPHFYNNVGQKLTQWVPKPPKPVKLSEQKTDSTESQIKIPSDPAPVSVEPPLAAKPRELVPGNNHGALLDIPWFLRRVAPSKTGL